LDLPYAVPAGQVAPPAGADLRTLKAYADEHALDGLTDEKALVLPDAIDSEELDALFDFIFNFKP
jgi:hypothetical protein